MFVSCEILPQGFSYSDLAENPADLVLGVGQPQPVPQQADHVLVVVAPQVGLLLPPRSVVVLQLAAVVNTSLFLQPSPTLHSAKSGLSIKLQRRQNCLVFHTG